MGETIRGRAQRIELAPGGGELCRQTGAGSKPGDDKEGGQRHQSGRCAVRDGGQRVGAQQGETGRQDEGARGYHGAVACGARGPRCGQRHGAGQEDKGCRRQRAGEHRRGGQPRQAPGQYQNQTRHIAGVGSGGGQEETDNARRTGGQSQNPALRRQGREAERRDRAHRQPRAMHGRSGGAAEPRGRTKVRRRGLGHDGGADSHEGHRNARTLRRGR